MRPRLSTLWRKNNLFSSPPLWSRYSPLIDVVLAYDQEDLYRRGRRLARPGSRSIASRVSTATCHHASAVWRMVRRKGGHKSRLCMHASKKKNLSTRNAFFPSAPCSRRDKPVTPSMSNSRRDNHWSLQQSWWLHSGFYHPPFWTGFPKGLGNCRAYWDGWSDPTGLHLESGHTDVS